MFHHLHTENEFSFEGSFPFESFHAFPSDPHRQSLCITFDDGLKEQLHAALKFLIPYKHKVYFLYLQVILTIICPQPYF